jgi:hypothetical protein
MVLMVAVLLVHPAAAYIVPTTVLYIPGNATSPSDLSPAAQTITLGGGASVINSATAGSNSPPKFGNGSILLNGTSDCINTTVKSMNLGTNAWYLGMYVNESTSGDGTNGTFISVNTNETAGDYSAFSVQRLGLSTLLYKVSINGTTNDFAVNGTITPTNNTWNYVACKRVPATGIWCGINGVHDVNITVPSTQAMYYSSTGKTIIGSSASMNNFTAGSIDEVVLINGDGYSVTNTPPWEFVKPLEAAFALNKTFISDYENDNENFINVTSNVYDITAETFAWTFGDPLQPTLSSALSAPVDAVYYRHQGIFTIKETVNNTYTSASNTTWVLAVN